MALHVFLFGCITILGLTGGNELYNGGVVSDSLPGDSAVAEDDPHCTHHIHKFYRQMKCQPEMTAGVKCPTSYKCATLQGRSHDLCYFAGQHYPVGHNLTREDADFHTPCIHNCQCVRMYEGARFYCSQRQGSLQDCPSPPGCRHFGFLEDFSCCERGITSCNKGKQDSVKCVYEGRSYSEGERFFPYNDITCTQCICASGFNGTVEPPYCQEFTCELELWGDTPIVLTRGCIPVYLSDNGCCPVAYRCPKPSDRVIHAEKKSDSIIKTDMKCHFGNLTMDVGDHLSPWAVSSTNAKHVECSCRVPPLASCVRKDFVLSEDLRREIAREGLDNQS